MSAVRTADCVVAGGGPAGLMAGYLMARAGVDTVVLEKHGDFLRDFRGDTVHPSSLEIFHELGLLDRFLQRPHQRMEKVYHPDVARPASTRNRSGLAKFSR